MTNPRLDAGFWGDGLGGAMALLMTGVACTSLQDLSSYSAGSSDDAAPPPSQAAVESVADEAPPPAADAGVLALPGSEVQNPANVALVPTAVDDADDCTGPGEFTDPEAASCYLLGDTTSSWRDARDFCETWGGDLAKVESADENAQLSGRTEQDAWLGASDFEDEGNFRWVDGDEVDPDGLWSPAQPDNFEGREDCMELRQADDLWNDVPCMSPKLALCERALGGEAGQ